MPEFGLVHYNYLGTFEEFLNFAANSGFRCTELLGRDIWNLKDGEAFADAVKRATQIRDQLKSRGMRASAVAPGNDFLVVGEEAMAAQIERMKQFVELAGIIGTDILRIDGGWAKPEVPEDRQLYIDLISEGISRCCPFVGAAGMRMALDNHGLVTNDADLQVEIMERVNSPVIGANVDTMNYRWAGHDLDTVRRFYDTIAPWVIHTHFKDGHGSRAEYVGTALGDGEVPLKYAAESFKAAGYKGPWLVEYEGKGDVDREEGFRRGLQWLQANI